MKDKINNQYNLLEKINQKNARNISYMKQEYQDAVKIYEDLQSKVIQEEIKNLVSVAKELFPNYEIVPTKFGIKISSKNDIIEHKGSQDEGKDENSGLGDYDHGQKIYKTLIGKLGSIIKTADEDIAWFEPAEDNWNYDEKSSWVYTEIVYEFKKSYLNKKFDFKSAPLSVV